MVQEHSCLGFDLGDVVTVLQFWLQDKTECSPDMKILQDRAGDGSVEHKV